MKKIKIPSDPEKMTFDELMSLGLPPNCSACINSKAEDFLIISCKKSKIKQKFCSFDENMFEEKCEDFKTNFMGIMSIAGESKELIEITYRNRKYINKMN